MPGRVSRRGDRMVRRAQPDPDGRCRRQLRRLDRGGHRSRSHRRAAAGVDGSLGTRVYEHRTPAQRTLAVSDVGNRRRRAAVKYFGDRLLADTLIPISIVVTQLGGSGFKRRALTARDPVPLATAVLASCFLPGPYSRMVPIDRRLTVDGAWLAACQSASWPSSALGGWSVCERRRGSPAARRVVDDGRWLSRRTWTVVCSHRSHRCRSARSTSIARQRSRRSPSGAPTPGLCRQESEMADVDLIHSHIFT